MGSATQPGLCVGTGQGCIPADLFAASVVSMVVDLALMIAAVICLVHTVLNPRSRSTDRSVPAFALIVFYAVCPLTVHLSRVLGRYASLPRSFTNFLHAFPLTLVFAAVSLVLHQWVRIVTAFQRKPQPSLLPFWVSNGFVLAALAVDVIVFARLDTEGERILLIGIFNIITGCASLILLCFYCWFGFKIVRHLRDRGLLRGKKKPGHKALMQTMVLFVITLCCFVLAAFLLLYDGIYLVKYKSFRYFFHGGYVSDSLQLYGYLIAFTWPMVCIMWMMRPVRFHVSTVRDAAIANAPPGLRDLEQRLLMSPPEDVSDAHITHVLDNDDFSGRSIVSSHSTMPPLQEMYPRSSWRDTRRLTDPEPESPAMLSFGGTKLEDMESFHPAEEEQVQHLSSSS